MHRVVFSLNDAVTHVVLLEHVAKQDNRLSAGKTEISSLNT